MQITIENKAAKPNRVINIPKTIQKVDKRGNVPNIFGSHDIRTFTLRTQLGSFSKPIDEALVDRYSTAIFRAKSLIQQTLNNLQFGLSNEDKYAFEWSFGNYSDATIGAVIQNYLVLLAKLNEDNLIIEDKNPILFQDERTKGYVLSPGLPRFLFGGNIHIDFGIDSIDKISFILIHEGSHAFLNTEDKSYLISYWKILQEIKQMDEYLSVNEVEGYNKQDFSIEKVKENPKYYPEKDEMRPDTENADSYAVFAFICNGKELPNL